MLRKLTLSASLGCALFLTIGCSSPSKQAAESEKRAAITETTVPGGQIDFKADPALPKFGSPTNLLVALTGSDGKAIPDALVIATFVMPETKSMKEMKVEEELAWNGRKYEGKVTLPASGKWNLTVQATKNNQNLVVYHSPFVVQ